MRMNRYVRAGMGAALALTLASPALAQEISDAGSDQVGQTTTNATIAQPGNLPGDLPVDGMMKMLGGMFASEPLTPSEELRLPAAAQVVGTMMPDGFYGKLMDDMISGMLGPMMRGMFGPKLVLMQRGGADQETVDALDEAQVRELAHVLDPAFDSRADTLLAAITGGMGDMFTALEPPLRQGLARAYAQRFDAAQLADIAAFFRTPTGSVYATELLALWMDPQVMSAMMRSLPMIMGSMGDMAGSIETAMAALPAAPGYDALSAADRARLTAALGVDDATLKASIEAAAQRDESAAMGGLEETTADNDEG